MESRDQPQPYSRFWLKLLAIALVLWLGVLPTLDWLEFSSGTEKLVVLTVLEMHRGGPRLVPTLNGEPRTTKPPLANWICASLINPATVRELSDPTERESAYRRLAWQVRWPAWTFACLTIVAAGWLGRALFSGDVGIATGAIAGGTILFLRFGRSMTTDVQLALWVTVANACFVMALLRGRRWGAVAGGAALGLALMSKGPVALAQTVAPLIVWWLWSWWRGNRIPIRWLVILSVAAIALAIALPWPLWVLMHIPGRLEFWMNQMTHASEEGYSADPMWTYLAIVPLLLPWMFVFFIGLVVLWRQRSPEAMLTLCMLVVPLVIMSCFKEKNERYLLPMIAPAAIACAAGLLRSVPELEGLRKLGVHLTWATLGVIVIGLPMAGGFFLKRADGAHWWPVIWGVMAAMGGGVVVGIFVRNDP